MFDKQRIIQMTTDLENFVSTHNNVYIFPQSIDTMLMNSVCWLLKLLKVNVVSMLTNDQAGTIQTEAGIYHVQTFSNAIQNFDDQTGMIMISYKSEINYMVFLTFNNGISEFQIPAFRLNNEEALAIYDRLTLIQILNQYQRDGIVTNIKDLPLRFARGISTFMNPKFQDLKIELWDRRELKLSSYEVSDAAIVIQGPLEHKDNYTLTTARLYRQWYPNAPIVISTWKNEATDIFRKSCAEISVTLLENELPVFGGISNTNYQLESSARGVEYVKNNTSAKFVLKCRSDQRINRTKFLIYFKNLLEMYPPKGDKLKKRILMASFDKGLPFFGCDFLYFGTVEDLNKLFNIPEQVKKDCDYWVHHQKLREFLFTNSSISS